MRKEEWMNGGDKWEYEQLEAEIQALLQSPVPMKPEYKARLREDLLREHRRLYGKAPLAKWRWPLGIVSGTAAAALMLVFASQFLQGEHPFQQREMGNGGNGLVWEQTGQSPVSEGEGSMGESGKPSSAGAELLDADEAARTEPVSDSEHPEDMGTDDNLLVQSDGNDGAGSSAERVMSADDGKGAQSGVEDGQAVAMSPAKGRSGTDNGAQTPDAPTEDSGSDSGKPIREFVFSSSYITMSSVVPFRADTLPANVELNVNGLAVPKEMPVYAYADHMPLDMQQRQAVAEALGLGDDEQATAKGFRYRGADGSTLLFAVDGIPFMEYVYRGDLPVSDGDVPESSSLSNGENETQWVERAKDFLKQIRINTAEMKAQVQPPAEGDKWTVTFIPEMDGVPNLSGAVTVHMMRGTVVEAKVPLLVNLKEKSSSTPLIPLTDVLQRIVFSEEYFIQPDEKVVIREAELVFYAFGNGTLAPAYQLRGVEEKSGKYIQLIVSAVMADEAGN